MLCIYLINTDQKFQNREKVTPALDRNNHFQEKYLCPKPRGSFPRVETPLDGPDYKRFPISFTQPGIRMRRTESTIMTLMCFKDM